MSTSAFRSRVPTALGAVLVSTCLVTASLVGAASAGAVVTAPSASPSTSPTSSPTSSPTVGPGASPSPEPSPSAVPLQASPSADPGPAASEAPVTEPIDQASAATASTADVAALTAAPQALVAPVAASDEIVEYAASWLAGELSADGTVTGSFPDGAGGAIDFTDWGRSLDSALALLAAGSEDAVLGRTLTSVESASAVAEYTQGAPGDRPDAAYVGATAKLALVVELTGGDATDVAGVDLLAQLRSLERSDLRFEDLSDFGDFANVFGHAFAVLALDTAGSSPGGYVDALLDTQCEDGSFPVVYPTPGTRCATGGVDATGLVLQALAAVDLTEDPDALRAVAWLLGQQQSDGSFPGEAPVNSTGYAVLGLNAFSAPTGEAVPYLINQRNSDGGLSRGAGELDVSDLFATAQALPALAGTTFQDSARTVARVALDPAPDPSPSPSPSFFEPDHGDGLVNCPGGDIAFRIELKQPPSPAPTCPATPVSNAGSGAGLPITGAELPALLLAGGVLIVAGGVVTAAARPRPQRRRSRGRHAAAR